MNGPAVAARSWLDSSACDLDEFRSLVESSTDASMCPSAIDVCRGVPIYDGTSIDPADRSLLAEFAAVLDRGPGIVVLAAAFAPDVVNAATAAFEGLITAQHAAGHQSGDHFAAPGANDRVWNALGKLAVAQPETFVDYYANPALAAICRAWLGPWYQVTSQVNVVNPGGQAQEPHRDYHLGFLTDEQASQFPAHVHRLSPLLTLQGAVAHCPMPVETGPTMYLPHSHKFTAGYLAWRRADFKAYFAEHFVQLPLGLGDAVFFNPALFHGAGSNVTTDVRRMANLLQVSSATGRAMESIDRTEMCAAVYPALLDRASQGWSDERLSWAIAATAEGYPFPTNLDHDPPLGGLAPPSQADLLCTAVNERWTPSRLGDELTAAQQRRSATVTP